jgi:hypothetical protein
MGITYTAEEIKQILRESNMDNKPVLGGSVTSTNKKNNTDAVKSAMKSVEDSTKNNIGGESKPVKFNTGKSAFNGNKTNLDLEYEMEPSQAFKDRVKNDIIGASTSGNGSNETVDNSGNIEFYNNSKLSSKEKGEKEHILKTSGLVGKNIDLPKKPTAFEGVDLKKTKRLNFKNTQFFGEEHIMSLIPEDYKKDGNKFIMKDKAQNEYLVEWTVDEFTNKGKIKGHENKVKIVEDIDRIKSLFKYNSKDKMVGLNNEEKKVEESAVKNIMDKVRNLSE